MSPSDELQNIAPIGLLPIRSATLIYGKAGVTRANSQIDMAINNDLAGFAGPDIASNSTNTTFWGWTVGLGIEQALSVAWSLKVEYDYIGFPSHNIANLGSATVDMFGTTLSTTPAGSSGVSQNVQLVKLGLNYKWGANPLLWGDGAPVAGIVVKDAPAPNWLAGWDAEGGAHDKWRAMRVGVSGETQLINRLRLSGDVAYLPVVNFTGVDTHFFSNTGQVASINPESANKGAGVQIEATLSYFVTSQFSVGVGGRYWALWTNNGQANRTVDEGAPIAPTPPQAFRGTVEQAGVFLQAAYRFGAICF